MRILDDTMINNSEVKQITVNERVLFCLFFHLRQNVKSQCFYVLWNKVIKIIYIRKKKCLIRIYKIEFSYVKIMLSQIEPFNVFIFIIFTKNLSEFDFAIVALMPSNGMTKRDWKKNFYFQGNLSIAANGCN